MERFHSFLEDSELDFVERKTTVTILTIVLGVALVGSAVLLVVGMHDQLVLTQIVPLATLVLVGILIGLTLRGHLLFPRVLTPFVAFGVSLSMILENEGLRDVSFYLLPLTIILAGLLLGRKGIVIFGSLCFFEITVIILVEINGLLVTPYNQQTTYITLIGLALSFGLIGLSLYFLVDIMNRNVDRAKHAQMELTRKNQELQLVQRSLEERIEERTCSSEQARQETELARQAVEAQAWLATGQSQLNDVMRGDLNLPTLADNIVRYLCHYLEAQTGVIFILDRGILKRAGGYAYSPQAGLPEEFLIGEGLVGQAAQSKEIVLLEEIPADSIVISSSLGDTLPKSLVLVPLLYNGDLVGLVELGTIRPFLVEHLNFLALAQSNIAIALHTTQARMRVDELLAETQRQAEELQAQAEEMRVQEEELRAANEELLAQAESQRARAQEHYRRG
jgi:putative methionine-R-sulfoxide reductase with GAF domain